MDVTAIVLAGGKNIRLGRIKALEVINGKSLIEHVMERVRPLVGRVLVVTSPQLVDLLAADEAEVLVDLYPGRGPLGGIYTGLASSKSLHNIAVACDMPFLNADLLKYMLGLAADYDAVVPRLKKGMIEPLHSVYSGNCLDTMKERLENGQLSISSFLDTVNVRYVEPDETRRFDPEGLSFFNINYQSDIDRAIQLLKKDTR